MKKYQNFLSENFHFFGGEICNIFKWAWFHKELCLLTTRWYLKSAGVFGESMCTSTS